MLAGPSRYASGGERRLGYEQTLIEHGLRIDPALIKVIDFKSPEAEVAATELLSQANRPISRSRPLSMSPPRGRDRCPQNA